MFLSACVGEIPTTHTSSQHFFISSKPPHSNMGKPAFHYVLVVICASSKATLHQRQVLETGFSSLRSFIQHQDRAIEQQLSGCIILGVRPYFSCPNFSVFPCLFFNIFPPILRHSELLLSSHGFNNELHAWGLPGWITSLQYFLLHHCSCRFG
jgi:hypothetical protein